MSVILRCITVGLPLREYEGPLSLEKRGSHKGISHNTDNVAAEIVRQLTHPRAVKVVADGWNELPMVYQGAVCRAANERVGTTSGGLTKGILALDKLISGKLLSKAGEQTVSVLTSKKGDLFVERKRLDAAKIGAMRKYGIDRAFVDPLSITRG